MPIARSTMLWGHVITSLVSNAISIVVIILVALVMGFRSSAGVQSWLAVAGILTLFTLALTWVAMIAGLSAKTVDGAKRLFLPAYLPSIYQFGVRSNRVDAVGSSILCRKSAGDLDSGRHPRAPVEATCRK